MWIQIVLLVLVCLYVVIFHLSDISKSDTEDFKGKDILFVLAHPDDESMFFTPTISCLAKVSNLHVLMLSNGDYDGLGKIREKEMEKVANHMGFKSCKVLNEDALADGPWTWSSKAVSEAI